MKDELTDFLRFCAVERRLAPLTCAAYERDVSACLGYLQGQGLEDLAEVRPTHLRAFLAEDAKRRPAPSSQARATAALKSFFRFLVDDERLERDPARPLRTPKKREALPDVLTMAELERLLAAPARGDILERHLVGKPECDLAPPDHPGGRPSRQARIELLNPKDTAQYGLIPITRRELTTGNTPRDETARLRRRGPEPIDRARVPGVRCDLGG